MAKDKVHTTQLAQSAEPNVTTTVGQADSRVVDANNSIKVEELIQELDELEMAKRARAAKHHKKWLRRLKIFFCCLGYKKNKDSIADVASIFAEFYADLDVPSSDIAAGFVLLSKYQEAQRQWILKSKESGVEQYLSSLPITGQTNFLDISTAEDSHLINDLIYYMNYSLAIFGWPMQVIDDPCMLCCICPYLKCGSNTRQSSKSNPPEKESQNISGDIGDDKKSDNKNNYLESNVQKDAPEPKVASKKRKEVPGQLNDDFETPIILEDNCCGCNVASVERRLASHNYEIIYVSYKVNVNVVPFLVAADHSKQSIVVAIRGSMSLSDMVTDMNGTTDKIPIENCPDDWLCHRGITRAASYVKSTLITKHILDSAFNCRPDLGSPNYNLILCGHSLGAGVAAILGILMRSQYPSLKAYLYSPPGGCLSLPAVEYTKEFAVGIVLGNDCVPRLGMAQLERLRYQVLLSLKSSQKSSGRILAKALCPSFCIGTNKVDYDPDQSLNILHGTEGRSFDYNGFKIPFQVQPEILYVPGKLIHIVKNHNFKSKSKRLFKEPIYQAIWNDNVVYDRVVINEGMFFDHLPNNLMHAMKMLFSKTLPARRESKSTDLDSSQNDWTTIDNNPIPHCKSSEQNEDKQLNRISAFEDDNNNNTTSLEPVSFDENNNPGKSPVNIKYQADTQAVVGDDRWAQKKLFRDETPNDLDSNANDDTVNNRNQ